MVALPGSVLRARTAPVLGVVVAAGALAATFHLAGLGSWGSRKGIPSEAAISRARPLWPSRSGRFGPTSTTSR